MNKNYIDINKDISESLICKSEKDVKLQYYIKKDSRENSQSDLITLKNDYNDLAEYFNCKGNINIYQNNKKNNGYKIQVRLNKINLNLLNFINQLNNTNYYKKNNIKSFYTYKLNDNNDNASVIINNYEDSLDCINCDCGGFSELILIIDDKKYILRRYFLSFFTSDKNKHSISQFNNLCKIFSYITDKFDISVLPFKINEYQNVKYIKFKLLVNINLNDINSINTKKMYNFRSLNLSKIKENILEFNKTGIRQNEKKDNKKFNVFEIEQDRTITNFKKLDLNDSDEDNNDSDEDNNDSDINNKQKSSKNIKHKKKIEVSSDSEEESQESEIDEDKDLTTDDESKDLTHKTKKNSKIVTKSKKDDIKSIKNENIKHKKK